MSPHAHGAASLRHAVLGIGLALCAAIAPAQSTQTLPRGFDAGTGGSGSAYPFNSTTDHTWQWHYDWAQFNSQGPIFITQVYVRVLGGLQANAFNFPSVELTMASSPTDYTVAGVGGVPGHSTTLAANLNPDATVVRPASAWSGAPAANTWIPMNLAVPFYYNPTLHNDFVLQIRKCGAGVVWGQNIFGASGAAGVVGGNRYGDIASCAATVSTFSNNEYVPIIRIDYTEYNNLAITQSGPGVGDLLVTVSQLSPTAVEGYMLLSTTVSQPTGSGPLLGLFPDAITWSFLNVAYFPGNPLHFSPLDVGVFPQTPFFAPPGSVLSLTGQTFDFAMLLLTSGLGYDSRSNVVRLTFQ